MALTLFVFFLVVLSVAADSIHLVFPVDHTLFGHGEREGRALGLFYGTTRVLDLTRF